MINRALYEKAELQKMNRTKTLIVGIVLISVLICIMATYSKDQEISFEYVTSFEWIRDINADKPVFGTLWWALYGYPESYISLDAFDEMFHIATNRNREDIIHFDFDSYTYIILEGHELIRLCYNEREVWGRFTAKYPIYHGKVWIKPSQNQRTINIYRIKKMLINSDEHHRSIPRDSGIIIVNE